MTCVAGISGVGGACGDKDGLNCRHCNSVTEVPTCAIMVCYVTISSSLGALVVPCLPRIAITYYCIYTWWLQVGGIPELDVLLCHSRGECGVVANSDVVNFP